MAADLILRARAGDGGAFRALTEPHRRELQVHCYRMLGSLQDAEDALQDTLLAAWQGFGGFEGRASLLADGAQVQLDELSFTVREVGPAESHADSYLVLTANGSAPIAFTGDLAFHGTHAYTADGHSGAWLAALDVVSGELAGTGTLYPGHGDPAGPALFAGQRRYLLYYRELIRRLSGGEPQLSEAAKSELSTALQAFLPDAPLTWMIELGADAVAAELAIAGGSTTVG